MDPSFEAGRTAPAETLALELATAPLVFLEGALANPAMQPCLVSILLKNHTVTGQVTPATEVECDFWGAVTSDDCLLHPAIAATNTANSASTSTAMNGRRWDFLMHDLPGWGLNQGLQPCRRVPPAGVVSLRSFPGTSEL